MADGDDGERRKQLRARIAFWMILALIAFWMVGAVVTTFYIRSYDPPAGEMSSAWADYRSWVRMVWPTVTAAWLGLAAWAVRRPTVGWQIAGRVLIAGPMATRIVHGGLRIQLDVPFLLLVALTVIVLALLGRAGLEPDDGPFQPTRIRGLLLLLILGSGVMAFASLSIIGGTINALLIRPDYQIHWPMEARRVIFGSAYLATAMGIYRMRAVAFLIPLGLFVYFLANAFTEPEILREDLPAEAKAEVARQILLGEIWYTSLVALLVAPFVGALAWIRLQARRERRARGEG